MTSIGELGRPERVGMCSERLQRASAWLDAQVEHERLPGGSLLIGRGGMPVWFHAAGHADVATGRPFTADTIARIYSMTKAVTTVAAMILFERGCFSLDDPVRAFLPEFADTPVWRGGDAGIDAVEPQHEPMTVRHLITHTSGLTYGFMQSNVVDAAYRAGRLDFPGGQGDLAEQVRQLAALPLICQPGSAWNYSAGIDVLGRLIEVWSGQDLAQFFRTEITEPLGMVDTAFQVAPAQADRFAALYTPSWGATLGGIAGGSNASARRDGGLKLQESATDSPFLNPPKVLAGGGGLTGTIGDYSRFCRMLLGGGELGNTRILGRKTVEFMRLNHLPGNRDMAGMGQPVWSETSYEGIGFGLGWAVVLDPAQAQILTSVGEHHWGGAASTFFWLDPQEDLFAILFTQLMPSSAYPLRKQLRTRVYQALVG